MEAFHITIRNVQTVGLSFGRGCFLGNGVTTSDGMRTFDSTFTQDPIVRELDNRPKLGSSHDSVRSR